MSLSLHLSLSLSLSISLSLALLYLGSDGWIGVQPLCPQLTTPYFRLVNSQILSLKHQDIHIPIPIYQFEDLGKFEDKPSNLSQLLELVTSALYTFAAVFLLSPPLHLENVLLKATYERT